MRPIDEGFDELKQAEEDAEEIKEQFGDPSPEYRDAMRNIDAVRRKCFGDSTESEDE
ncbi:MAG: hypothetical protein KUG82_15395 [Pseudomonadales bacterium]|nr:hypothetical protein [Pseudomonadales bacterium]